MDKAQLGRNKGILHMLDSLALRTSVGMALVLLVSALPVLLLGISELWPGSEPNSPMLGVLLALMGGLVACLMGWSLWRQIQLRQMLQREKRMSAKTSGERLEEKLSIPMNEWSRLEPEQFTSEHICSGRPHSGLNCHLSVGGLSLSYGSDVRLSPHLRVNFEGDKLMDSIQAASGPALRLSVNERLPSADQGDSCLGMIDLYAGSVAADSGSYSRRIESLAVTLQATPDAIRIHAKGLTGPLIASSVKDREWLTPPFPGPYAVAVEVSIARQDFLENVHDLALREAVEAWLARCAPG